MLEAFQSILISAIVGLFAFAFGMKRGKNQADRSKAQKIYTELLNEFESINATLSSQPKILSDYPRKKEWRKESYITPLREILMDGEYVFLSENQRNELKKLEEDSFAYGDKALNLAMKIPAILDARPELFKVPGKCLRNDPLFSSQFDNWYVMGDVRSLANYRNASAFCFFDSRLLSEEIEEGSVIDFNDERRPSSVRVIIVPEQLKVSPEEFANEIYEELMLVEEGCQLEIEKKNLEQRLDKAVKLLRKQARDPFPFWRTLCSAIRDFFKAN